MRAIQISRFGGPEVLELLELPVPEPKDGEVLVKITRAGINYADTHQRTNSYLAKAELPLIPGVEVAGVRADTGERVVALCGKGGYAEYVTALEELVFPIPEGVGDGQALALLVQGVTAFHLLATSAKLSPGESVVVHSAAGGTGSLALQLAKHFAAGRVIATASSQHKREATLALGADAVTDSAVEDLAERLLRCNSGKPVDVVLEMAGGEVFEQSLKALAPFGRLVAYGIASQEQNRVSTGRLMRSSHAVVGFWINHLFERPAMLSQALNKLFELTALGRLKVVVGGTYPLSDVARAHTDLKGRKTAGKLLIDPSC